MHVCYGNNDILFDRGKPDLPSNTLVCISVQDGCCQSRTAKMHTLQGQILEKDLQSNQASVCETTMDCMVWYMQCALLEPVGWFAYCRGLRNRFADSICNSDRQEDTVLHRLTWIRPVPSIFISPKAEACFSSVGSAATVMSAPVERCVLMKSW